METDSEGDSNNIEKYLPSFQDLDKIKHEIHKELEVMNRRHETHYRNQRRKSTGLSLVAQ